MLTPPKGLLALFETLIPYVGIAVFFTTIRTILRQEWTSISGLLVAYSTSMVCAVGTGLFLDQGKHAPMTCFVGVALAALVSHDIVKVVLNFGGEAASDRSYGKRLVGAFLPKGAEAEPEEHKTPVP